MLPGQVNPLDLPPRPGLQEVPLDEMIPRVLLNKGSSYTDQTNSTDNFPPRGRRKREQEMIVRPEAYTDKEGRKHQVVFMVSKQLFFSH